MEKLNLNPSPYVEPAPDQTTVDHVIAIAKVGAAFPFFGAVAFPFFGAGVTLVDLLTAPARGKRMSDWCEDIRLHLNDLHRKVEGLTFESLVNSDAFFSALAQATQAALKTHRPEKLEALRNALLNVALEKEPDVDRQSIFLSLVERFTPLHLLLLRFFDDPYRYCAIRGRTLELPSWQNLPLQHLLFACIPGLEVQVGSPEKDREVSGLQLIELVLGELAGANLTRINTATQKPPTYCPWTSHLGRDFLDFITSPLEPKP